MSNKKNSNRSTEDIGLTGEVNQSKKARKRAAREEKKKLG